MIRPTVESDLPALQHALAACGAFNGEEVAVAMEILGDGVAGGVDGNYACFTAMESDQVAGYICIGRTPLTESTWHLYWICVHPGAQRRGIGKGMLGHAEAFVRSRAGRRLVIETSGREDYASARAFYLNAGYAQVGRIPNFYRTGDDCVIYAQEWLP